MKADHAAKQKLQKKTREKKRESKEAETKQTEKKKTTVLFEVSITLDFLMSVKK